MTKADVLDAFPELNVCKAYNINGQISEIVPFQMTRHNIVPVLERMAGWNMLTNTIDSYSELPEIMKSYVAYINNYIGIGISHISNGPGREQIIQVPTQ
jgi:adenylosuccinate synthase